MAILNSLLNMGESRLLGKVYLNDIDIGNDVTVANDLTVGGDITNNGTLSVGKSTAANAVIYLNNKIAIKGTDTWLRLNDSKAFTSGIYTGSSMIRSDSGYQVGADGKSLLNTSANVFKVPTTITYATNTTNNTIALTVNGDTNISGTISANTANVTKGNIGELNAENAYIYGTLRAAKYSIETVQNLGGHFLVCPTIEVPSDAGGFSCQVTRPSSTSDKLTIVFTDNSLSTDTFEGTKWTANSKIKVTGTINNIALGTCDGTISNWETSNKRVEILITCGTAISSKFSTSATSVQVSDLSIMMYEVYTSNGTYPIGIYLTAYGKNKYSYIDVYSGTSATPVARMGKLDKNGISDLPTVNGITPTGWGFYAGGGSDGSGGGYFGGKLVSPAGVIGGFTIGSDAIYSSVNALGTTANNVYIGTEGISLGTTFKVTKAGALTATSGKIANWRIEGTYLATGTATAPAANTLILSPAGTSSSYTVAGKAKTGWMITAGTTFGVNKDGGIYATSGNIGNWTIGTNELYTGTWGSDNSAMLCTGTSSSKEIGGSDSINGWVFTAGANFGVTKTGALYANSAHISGEITSTSGEIGGWHIDTNKIYSGTHSAWNSTAEDGLYLGNDGIAGGSGGIWYLWKDGSAKIGAMTLSAAGVLAVPAANITGTLSADRIGANTLTIGKFIADDQEKILNENIEIGGRNLIHNTNVIDLSPTTLRPNINGDSATSGYLSASSGSLTAATHGARITSNSAVRPGLIFGSNNPSESGTHGLTVGREYTFSCDWETKTLGGSPVATTTYYLRAYLYYATSTSASSMTSQSFATWHTFETSDTSDRNTVISGHGSFTFTVPEDAAAWNIRIYSTNISTASLYAAGDYLQIENVKLETGQKATAWTPAPEDVDTFAEETRSIAEDAANASESLNEDIYGEPFYQYTVDGVTYDVWKSDDGNYYYDDGSGTDHEVAASSLDYDDDDDGYIVVRHGGMQDTVEKIAGSVLIDSAEPSVTIQAKHTDDTNERTAGIKITDERVSFKKNGEEVAYIDSSEDEGVIDINNARVHVSLRIGQLEIFDHDGGIGIRRYD